MIIAGSLLMVKTGVRSEFLVVIGCAGVLAIAKPARRPALFLAASLGIAFSVGAVWGSPGGVEVSDRFGNLAQDVSLAVRF